MVVSVTHFAERDWTSPPVPDDLPDELLERARLVRRKGLAAGEEGFFASHVTMPPGQQVEPHSHDHAELIVVVDGSMTFSADDRSVDLEANDSAVISAGTVYAFDVGADGVHFLLIRTGRARSTLAG